MSENGTIDDWLGWLAAPNVDDRRLAAQVLGDRLYPRGGLSDEDLRRTHQALLDAALMETDGEAMASALRSLIWSERSMSGVTGWDRLVEAAPMMPYEAQELALALLRVSGETAFAERMEVLAGEHPDFDHALTRKTIAGIRRSALSD